MMKKNFLTILIITACLIFSCSLPALAEDTATDTTQTEDSLILPEETITWDGTYPEYYQLTGTWTYTLVHDIVVSNNSKYMSFNIEVSIPLIDNHLPGYVALQGEQLSSLPLTITEDENGHRVAHYLIPYLYGNQSVTLSQRYVLDVSSLSYTFDRSNVADAYLDEEIAPLVNYLQPENGVESADPAIVAFAENIVSGISDPYQKARALFSAVNLYLSYSSEQTDQSATTVLERGTAYCQGYTNLYLACLRAVGIAARQQSGYLYMPLLHTTAEYVDPVNGRIKLNSLRHTWVEFFLPQIGWVAADPTFTYTYEINGGIQKFVDWSYFATINNERRYIFFREGSLNKESVDFDATGGDVDVEFNSHLLPGNHLVAFNDLEGHWAYDAVTYCVQNELFTGINATTFAPDQPMTRAMFVTVLGRLYEMLGYEIVAPTESMLRFRDIDPGAYYAEYLSWAVDNGLISGYGDGRFGPNDSVTREQMAKIIAQFAWLMGEEIALYEGAYLGFADSTEIADWAHTGIAYCSDQGIIVGMPGNLFAPDLAASRAQVATILQRIATILQE
jgi:transglutaminase-like putative cysteine protease